MLESRRDLFFKLAGAAGVLALDPFLASIHAQGHPTPEPQPRPSPNAPDPHVPNGMNGPQPTVGDPASELANQKELRADVARLYEMVSELKEQVEKTNSNTMLSTSLVKKAQQIEKLAKQIKDLAKG